jgi:hypothetical protein
MTQIALAKAQHRCGSQIHSNDMLGGRATLACISPAGVADRT